MGNRASSLVFPFYNVIILSLTLCLQGNCQRYRWTLAGTWFNNLMASLESKQVEGLPNNL